MFTDDVMLRCARMIGSSRTIDVPPSALNWILDRAEEAERRQNAPGPSDDHQQPSNTMNAPGRSRGNEEQRADLTDPPAPKDAPNAPGRSQDDDPVAWLDRTVTAPTPARDIAEAGARAGHTRRDLDRAKWELGVTSVRVAGRWYWQPKNAPEGLSERLGHRPGPITPADT